MQTLIEIETQGRGFHQITAQLSRIVRNGDVAQGVCHVFLPHTSASLILCENADPDVLVDMERWMSELVQDGHRRFTHRAEGPDDMAAHVRSVLTGSALSLPIVAGELELGTWQGAYLWEHRHHSHRRRLRITLLA